jgi:hypothetical protein
MVKHYTQHELRSFTHQCFLDLYGHENISKKFNTGRQRNAYKKLHKYNNATRGMMCKSTFRQILTASTGAPHPPTDFSGQLHQEIGETLVFPGGVEKCKPV